MMKQYFNFNLTGKKLLPVWLLFYTLFIIPYTYLFINSQNIQPGATPPLYIFPMFLVLFLIVFVLLFYMAKLIIEHVTYKETSVVFGGEFREFIGITLLGYFLSAVTLGIYLPWFIRNIHGFFVDNSSYNSSPFRFQGKGGDLFKIITLTFILPIIIMGIISIKILTNHIGQQPSFFLIYGQQIIIWILLISYMYHAYRWFVNIDYKNYNISWETNFWESCGQIAIQIFLTIITFGIYLPMASLKLYKYFTERTVANNWGTTRRFGFDDNDNMGDFVFIWAQILLSIATLGIYYPWAICNIYKLLLSKTYLE